MSRKNFIIIISAIIILMVGGFIFLYISSNRSSAPNITATTTNPFGNTPGDKTVGTSTPIQGNNQTGTIEIKNTNKLIQLYRNPTSGSLFFTNKNNQSILRFVDRATGNIYEYLPESQTGEVQRITNTTIPKIQETVWSNSGNNLALRYLDNDTDNINSFSAKINTSSSSVNSVGEITGLFLPQNIKQLVINPKGDKIFGLVDKSDKSGTLGFISNLDGSGKKTVFDSPISYWNVSWPKENLIAFTTKPNYKDPGLLYFFNTQTYSMDRVLGNIVGLSTLVNKDASLIAYSYSTNNYFSMDIYDVTNKISKKIDTGTLADKCVWGNANSKVLYCAIPKNITPDNYPDSWYQGLESFSDNLWEIDTENNSASLIYEIGLNEGEVDAFDLKISMDDQYLSYSDKNDLSLWLLQIKK